MRIWGMRGVARLKRVVELLSQKTVSREAWLEIEARLKPLTGGMLPASEAVTMPMEIIGEKP